MKRNSEKIMPIGKIKAELETIEVRGQGCWDDCYISGYWINRQNKNSYGCNWIGPKKTPYKNPFA